jgi:hypothetical protein
MEFSFGTVGTIAAVVFGSLVLFWTISAARLVLGSNGLPQTLGKFVSAAGSGRVDEAYAMTTEEYRQRVKKTQFLQVINRMKLRQYKASKPGRPQISGKRFTLPVTMETRSGEQVALSFVFVQIGKEWRLDDLGLAQ